MNIYNLIFGFLLIILGILIVKYYEEEVVKGGLSFKIRTGGIGCIIVGIGFILREMELI